MGRLILVTGGARSGKSRFAETLARKSGDPVVFLATMEPCDEETAARIAVHQARRPETWRTVEATRDLPEHLTQIETAAFVLLDCIGLWVTNELLAAVPNPEGARWSAFERGIEKCIALGRDLIAASRERSGILLAVTNEVGSGIVPLGALSRAYQDALGLVNQELARSADEVHLLVSGLPLRIKPMVEG
jgi:adenosylcobinamide kinase / adenosylcobinamide-phosphate guanylyltransferase